MPEFVKKNRGFILVGLALLVLVTFFWPKQPEQQVLPPTLPIETVDTKKPVQSVPLTRKEQAPKTSNDPVLEENNKPEEEYVEQDVEEDQPASTNYILCEHIVSGESQYEFTGQIRLINKGTKPVYGWSVSWEYEDGSTIVEASGVALSGNNPYTGQYLSENAEIPPGETVTFSFTGIKNGDSAPRRVDVTGDLCM